MDRIRRLALAVPAVSLVLAGAAPALGSRPNAPRSTSAAGQTRTQLLAIDAYLYGIPLMEFLRQARQQTSVTVPNSTSDAPVNQLGSARELANAKNQVIVQPNNDTLYTMGHLDLSAGPLVLHVPALPNHRYYSIEFLDPYTNVFAYVGTRTTGDGPGNFVITGPGFRGRMPPGLRRIRSRFQRAWLVGRTLVYGPHDLSAVHRIQAGYHLIPLTKYLAHGPNWRPPRPRHVIATHRSFREPKGVAFFDALGTALAQNPPPGRDAAMLRELRQVGVGPGLHPSQEHLKPATLAALRAAADTGAAYVNNLRTSVATQSVLAHNGWFIPPADTGDYGTDYRFRAVVALFGIAANRPAEAMYIIGVTDPTHARLNGAHDYLIHFPPGRLPPARYFWSLTMYNEQFFLVANPINRYEIGNRSPGLQRNPDGSLDVYVQRTAPPGHETNWLPAPSGTFEMTLRLYGPLPSALQRHYVYPAITLTR
jgi:hypothetical protein